MKEIKKFQNLLKTFKFEDSTVCDLNDNTIRLSIGTKDFKKEDNISDILLRLKYTMLILLLSIIRMFTF